MSRDPKSITERLIVQADEALKKVIKEAIAPIGRLINNGGTEYLEVRAFVDGKELRAKVNPYNALEEIEKLAFAVRAPAERQRVIDEFMEKVDSLGRDVGRLQAVARGDEEF